MPVNGGVLRQLVADEDTNLVPFNSFDGRGLATDRCRPHRCAFIRVRIHAATGRRRGEFLQFAIMRHGSVQPLRVTTG